MISLRGTAARADSFGDDVRAAVAICQAAEQSDSAHDEGTYAQLHVGIDGRFVL